MKTQSKQNLFFIAIVLIIAVFLFFIYSKQGNVATVTFPDREQIQIPLNKNQQYDFVVGEYTIHLLVQDHTISFINSECPDHLCEGFGKISNVDQMATCLPAGVAVIIGEG